MFKQTSIIILFGLSLATGLRADMRVSTGDAMKAATSKPNPEYSAVAKQMKVSGKVEVEVNIATDGTVEAVKVLTGNPLLTGSTISAVKRWKFTPFTANGEPVKAVAAISFEFKQ